MELNNYTGIPNSFLGNPYNNARKGSEKSPGLMAEMKDCELRVYLALLRATLGYHQTSARLSVRTIMLLTGLSNSRVQEGSELLEARGLAIRHQDGGITLWDLGVDWSRSEPIREEGPAREGVPPVGTGVPPVGTDVPPPGTPSNKEKEKEKRYSAEPEKTLSGEEQAPSVAEIDVLEKCPRFSALKKADKQRVLFDCPYCDTQQVIGVYADCCPVEGCGAQIIWRNNPLFDQRAKKQATDAKAKERNRQKSDDPAVRYLETATDARVKPEEVREIQNFVTRNGLPRFMALVDDTKAKATDNGKWGRGIVVAVVNRLPHWGNGKSAEKKSTSEPVEQAVNLPKGTVMTIRPEALAKLKELGIE